MDTKMHRIARRIVSSHQMKLRGLLKLNISVDVEDENHSWLGEFNGPKSLTPDGVARWSVIGTLDTPVSLEGNKVVILGNLTDAQRTSVCSLLNTLAGNVNEDTYQKYVEK